MMLMNYSDEVHMSFNILEVPISKGNSPPNSLVKQRKQKNQYSVVTTPCCPIHFFVAVLYLPLFLESDSTLIITTAKPPPNVRLVSITSSTATTLISVIGPGGILDALA